MKEERDIASLEFIFCTDDKLSGLNQHYLNHDTLTDVITFNYNDEYDDIAGDIFISYERVKENAVIFDELPTRELHRVIIHAVLHLLGYDDSTEAERRVIREKENYYLTLLS